MHITASVCSPTDSLRNETLIDDRHVLITDEPPELGGDDTAPTPYELLAGATAACIATTIRLYARRKGWDVGELSVDVSWEGEVNDARCTYSVTLPDDLTDEQRERLDRVADACAVHRTLEHGVAFEHAAPLARG